MRTARGQTYSGNLDVIVDCSESGSMSIYGHKQKCISNHYYILTMDFQHFFLSLSESWDLEFWNDAIQSWLGLNVLYILIPVHTL